MIDKVFIPMGKEGYEENDVVICKVNGRIEIATHYWPDSSQYQAQHLLIIDTEAEIKEGEEVFTNSHKEIQTVESNNGVLGYFINDRNGFIPVSDKDALIQAAYPAIPNVPPILLTDVSTMVEAQMKCKVEVVKEPAKEGMKDLHLYKKSHWKTKYHPTGEICLKVVKEDRTLPTLSASQFADSFVQAFGSTATPNTAEDTHSHLRTKMQEYFANVTAEELIEQFKGLGYTFVPKSDNPINKNCEIIAESTIIDNTVEDKAREYVSKTWNHPKDGPIFFQAVKNYMAGHKAGYLSPANEQGKEAAIGFAEWIESEDVRPTGTNTWSYESQYYTTEQLFGIYTSQINHV